MTWQSRQTRSHRRYGRAFVALAAAAIAYSGTATAPASAATGNQTMTATTAAAGTLSITAPAAINLGGSLAPGSTVSNFALGSLSWTDTLNDSTASSVTVASTDLFASASKLDPFTNFTFNTGASSVGTQAGNTGTTPTVSGGGTLAGTDTTPGTTFSSAVALAGGSTTTEGTWSESGNTITVLVPASLVNSGAMTATIQYTITG